MLLTGILKLSLSQEPFYHKRYISPKVYLKVLLEHLPRYVRVQSIAARSRAFDPCISFCLVTLSLCMCTIPRWREGLVPPPKSSFGGNENALYGAWQMSRKTGRREACCIFVFNLFVCCIVQCVAKV